jgi:competence protein ComGC
LNVTKTEAKSLISRLIQEGYIEEEAINIRKGRKVIKKNKGKKRSLIFLIFS